MTLARNWSSTARALAIVSLAASAVTAGYSTRDAALAQTYPTKPIKLIITLSPGSAADSVGRIVGEGLSKQLGQPIIFENRAGGNGTIGANAVAKAEPDGYTLLLNTNLHTLAPALIAQMPFNVETDFAGVASLGVSPHVLIIASSQKIGSIKELVAASKTRAGGITYASVAGSGTHLNGAHFIKTMNIEGRMVPFKGAPESITEVMTGRVDIYFSPILPALPHIQSGVLRGLAVSSKSKSGALPNVPTTFESGYPDSEFGLNFYLLAPGKTPRAIVDKLNAEAATVINNPETKKRLSDLGIEPMFMKPTEFDAYLKSRLPIEAEQAKAAGLGKQ